MEQPSEARRSLKNWAYRQLFPGGKRRDSADDSRACNCGLCRESVKNKHSDIRGLASISAAKGGLVCSICWCLWYKHPNQFQVTNLSSLNTELWRGVPSWASGASASWLQLTTKHKKASNTIWPRVLSEWTEQKKWKKMPYRNWRKKG